MAVTDQGDLYQPHYLLSGCLHGYKSVAGWAFQGSSLIAVAIDTDFCEKGTFSKLLKADTHQEP